MQRIGNLTRDVLISNVQQGIIMKNVIFESNRIRVRKLNYSDIPIITGWWNDGMLMKDMGFKNGMGVTESSLLSRFSKQLNDNDTVLESRMYVITDCKTGKEIGELQYGELDLKIKKCRIAIKIGEIDFQRKGLGEEALSLFMDYLISEFSLHKIEIDTIHDNIRAYKLYKKLGFQETERIKDFWTDDQGNKHDIILMEKIIHIDNSTEYILQQLANNISTMEEVEAIGISGGKKELPKAGEGDIDVFIYCSKIPELEKRQTILGQTGGLMQESKMNVFEGGHWGVGDLVLINGIETWLMYFTVNETLSNVEAILNGDYPNKLDNYYYPIGRCAMLQSMYVLYDKSGFLNSLKAKLSVYPDELAKTLASYHLNLLVDNEDLMRAVNRKDILFYHFAMDLAIDHFLQALFAINKVYFPSRKRTLEFIKMFDSKPERCEERLLDTIKLGSCAESIALSYEQWSNLVADLKGLCG